MPSSMTHSFFILDVYEKLPKDIQNQLLNNKNYLKLFSQGVDPLYFYNLANLKSGKKIRDNYPELIHSTKTQKLFVSLINYVKENNLQKDNEIISLLYGFISHYVLDLVVHPFVIYKTGKFDKKDSNTFKYNGLHNDMEVYIDAYLIYKRLKIFPKDFKMYNFIFETIDLNKETKNMLDIIFKDVYDIDNFSSLYCKSVKQMKSIFKLYRYDKYGIKKLGYRILDFILPSNQLKKDSLSYYIHHKKKIHYLNLEKNTWNHPCCKTEYYDYSFVELYRIALSKAINIITKVNECLNTKVDISELYDLIENLSCITGKPCESNKLCQYFEF